MAELTVIVSTEGGTAYTFGAVSASDTFDNDGNTVLLVANGGASADTVTFVAQHECSYGVSHDTTTTLTNGTNKAFGPFSTEHFNNSSGHATVTHSFTTTVTCLALRVPRVQ